MSQNTRFSKGVERMMQFLYARKVLTALLISIYSVAILLMHDPLVKVSVFVMKRMSIPGYNLFISLLTLILLSLILGVVIYQLKKHTNQLKIKILLLVFILLWLGLHYVFLLEMNIEIIHAFAYGGLIILFYGYFRSYAAALIFSIPVMLIDEWNQYINLYPTYNQYWELNDVILDSLGEVFVLITFYCLNITKVVINQKWYKTPAFILMIGTIIVFYELIEFSIISTHTMSSTKQTIFIMSRLPHEGTDWYVHQLTKKRYLILSPKDALLVMVFMCSILMVGDRKLKIET